MGFINDYRLEHGGSLIEDDILDGSPATDPAHEIFLDTLIVRDEDIAGARLHVAVPCVFVLIGENHSLLADETLKLPLPGYFHCRRRHHKARISPRNRDGRD